MKIAFKKGAFSLLLTSLLVFLCVAPVQADIPELPHAFYGDLTAEGEKVPAGVMVIANIGGVQYGSVTTTLEGKYGSATDPYTPKLVVQGQSLGGKTIEFYVNNGYGEVKAAQTAVFTSGEITLLNLTCPALPVAPGAPVGPTPPPSAEEIKDIAEEDPGAAGDIIEDVAETDPGAAGDIIEEIAEDNPEIAGDIIEEVVKDNPDAAGDIIEEVVKDNPDAAGTIVEEVAKDNPDAAGSIVEEVAKDNPDAAGSIIEEVVKDNPDAAGSIIEEVAKDNPDAAGTIIEEVAKDNPEAAGKTIEEVAKDNPEAAGKTIEKVATPEASATVEQVATPQAARTLENVEPVKAGAVMDGLSTEKRTEVVKEMTEESLMERLPEMTAEKLHEIPAETLFKKLPDAPTDKLVDEKPPVPPPDAPEPVIVYTYVNPDTGAVEAQYMAIRAKGGEWVIVVGSPHPVDKLKIKPDADITDVIATVEDVTAPPEAAKLPSGVLVASFFDITLDNITPEQMLVAHIVLKVEQAWIEANNINKWSVFLNRYDEDAGKWVKLPTVKKDETADYVFYDAVINDFSLFAITGSTTAPADEFTASNLSISPTGVKAGETVTIAADITNVAGVTDKYVATLWVNSTVEDIKYLTLAKGQTTTVSFDVTKDEEGTYQVRIGRQLGSFDVVPPVAPPPKPAEFKVSQLSVTPAEVKTGEAVTVSATVANVGEARGSYEVALRIDGAIVETKTVALDGGKSTKVTFSVTKDVAATYRVEVDGQRDQFTVVAPPPKPPPVKYPGFKVSQLSIAPALVGAGELVTITAMVTNVGEAVGSTDVVLKVNGALVDSKLVAIGAGDSKKVTFFVTRDVAGAYQVEVDGQVGQFNVMRPGSPWWVWLIVGLVVGVAVFFLIRRRRR